MPTVAPPATTALLTTGLTSDTGSAAGASDALAGLFQSVLAQVVSQTTVTADGQPQTALNAVLASAATGTEATGTDVLAGLLALTEETGDDTSDESVNADLLAQLLATLGVNAQTLAQIQQAGEATAAEAGADALLATAAATAGTATEALPTAATLSPALRQFFDRAGFANRLPQPTADSQNQAAAALTGTAASPAQAETLPATTPAVPAVPVAVVPQTVSVADATRTAGRIPPVVLQTPVASDRAQLLPPAATPVEPDTLRPPVTEIQAVQAAPAVTAGQAPTATQLPDIDLPVPGTATPPQDAPKATFPLPAGVNLTVSGPRTTPTQAAPIAPATVPTVATPGAVTPNPPAPGITAAVAQPVVATAPADSGGLAGLATSLPQLPGQPFGLGDQPEPDSVPVTAGQTAPATAPRGEPAAAPAVDRPAVTPPPSPADQLAGPIVAHVQARPAAGETELRVRLDPPELGTVKLKIVSTGGDVRAELQVSSDAVRRVVESQLPELRQKLEDAGVRVQRMDVTTDSAGTNAGTARDDRGGRWQEPTPADGLPFQTARTARPTAVLATVKNRVDVTA